MLFESSAACFSLDYKDRSFASFLTEINGELHSLSVLLFSMKVSSLTVKCSARCCSWHVSIDFSDPDFSLDRFKFLAMGLDTKEVSRETTCDCETFFNGSTLSVLLSSLPVCNSMCCCDCSSEGGAGRYRRNNWSYKLSFQRTYHPKTLSS